MNNFPDDHIFAIRLADMNAFVKRNKKHEASIISAMNFITQCSNEGGKITGNGKMDGVFVERGFDCFETVIKLLLVEELASEAKKQFQEAKDNLEHISDEELDEATIADFEKILAGMKGGPS